MKKLLPFFAIIIFVLSGCKGEHQSELDDFLIQDHMELIILTGDWNWFQSSKPLLYGDTVSNSESGILIVTKYENINPETEGFSKVIVFQDDRKYLEYIDGKLTF